MCIRDRIDKDIYLKAVEELLDNEEHKKILMALTPKEYLGIASELAKNDDET